MRTAGPLPLSSSVPSLPCNLHSNSEDIHPSSNDTQAVQSLVMLTNSMELAKRSEAAGSIASLLSNSCESGPGLVFSTPSTSRNTFAIHEPEGRGRERPTDRDTLFRKGLFP